jgi:hypothetical protein
MIGEILGALFAGIFIVFGIIVFFGIFALCPPLGVLIIIIAIVWLLRG